MATIALQKFDYSPDFADDTLLEINGRTAGIIGWILEKLSLGTQSSLVIRRGEVEFHFSGLNGVTHIVCPFDAIRCAQAGVGKPFWQLIIGIVLALGGVGYLNSNSLYGIISIVVGVALAASYFLTQNIFITFSTGSMARAEGLFFNATVLDGKKVDLDLVLEAIAGLNQHLVKIHTHNGQATPPAKAKKPPVQSSPIEPSNKKSSQPMSAVRPPNNTSTSTIETLRVSAESPILDLSDAAEKNFRDGFKCYQQKQYDEAITLLTKALSINPNHANAYGCRAKCYQALGEDDQYQTDIQQFRRLNKK